MPSLENQTLALLAESIALDQGESKATGDAWLEERLGLEILASAISEGPIEGLVKAASPNVDPKSLGRQVSGRIEGALIEHFRKHQGGISMPQGFLNIPTEEVCSTVAAFLTIGLGMGPRAACPAGALILRRMEEPGLWEVRSQFLGVG
jgi:hypothetical protein